MIITKIFNQKRHNVALFEIEKINNILSLFHLRIQELYHPQEINEPIVVLPYVLSVKLDKHFFKMSETG